MAHQPHRSFAFGVAHAAMSAKPPVTQPSPPPVFVGLLYGLPPTVLLWAAIIVAARAFF